MRPHLLSRELIEPFDSPITLNWRTVGIKDAEFAFSQNFPIVSNAEGEVFDLSGCRPC